MICAIFVLFCCLGSTNTRSLFDDLPPIITDQMALQSSTPSNHQFLFQPVGHFATDVHYMHIRIPIYLKPILQNIALINRTMDHVKTLQSKATGPIIQLVAAEIQKQNKIFSDNFVDLISNLPQSAITLYQRKKRFFDILFGLTGTLFGIANSIAIASINTQIATATARTDMLIDITQIHDDHLHNIDHQLANIRDVLQDFVNYNPVVLSTTAQTMIKRLEDVIKRIENSVSQAQLHRLSPLTLSNEVLLSIQSHIVNFAKQNSYKSFVTHISDLFQIETSFVFQPNNLTFNILLHVPLVKPEFLLTLNQYIPFPLSQDFSANHSLTPAVGSADIIAVGNLNTFKIVSQSDLTSCHRLGDTYFCKGRNVLQTKMGGTCLGAIFIKDLAGMKSFCKFEITPLEEQVFQLSRNKWQVFSKTHFTTAKVCDGSVTPLAIGYSTSVQLNPSCKVRLQSHILYAEQEDTVSIEPIHFTWAWNVSAIFPNIPVSQFSAAMQSLHDYGLHIVEASDIIHHLKTLDTASSYSQLFTNPFNYVSLILGALAAVIGSYLLGQCYCKAKGKLVAPACPTQTIQPSAPPLFLYPQL